jgi:hypothetical protein
MSHGDADLAKLQSLFGLARSLGAGERLAWTLQSGLSLATAATLWLVWRGRRDFDIKAAAVAVGALLATPYLYMYDLVVLAVPMAFLIRLGRKDSFLPHEWPALAFASLLVLSFPLAKAPVGFAAVVIVAALVARRAFTADATAAAAERPSPAH